jgi:hypothetical protein
MRINLTLCHPEIMPVYLYQRQNCNVKLGHYRRFSLPAPHLLSLPDSPSSMARAFRIERISSKEEKGSRERIRASNL